MKQLKIPCSIEDYFNAIKIGSLVIFYYSGGDKLSYLILKKTNFENKFYKIDSFVIFNKNKVLLTKSFGDVLPGLKHCSNSRIFVHVKKVLIV